jgi:hypothetical protein
VDTVSLIQHVPIAFELIDYFPNNDPDSVCTFQMPAWRCVEHFRLTTPLRSIKTTSQTTRDRLYSHCTHRLSVSRMHYENDISYAVRMLQL